MTCDAQNRRRHRRRRPERRAWEPHVRTPVRPLPGPPLSHLHRHHQVRPHQPAVEQPAHQFRRMGERRVGHDAERPPRQPELLDRTAHDLRLRERPPQRVRPACMQFDRNDPRADLEQRPRQRAGARSEIQHQLTRGHTGVGDQPSRGAISERIPPPPGARAPGHDAPSLCPCAKAGSRGASAQRSFCVGGNLARAARFGRTGSDRLFSADRPGTPASRSRCAMRLDHRCHAGR